MSMFCLYHIHILHYLGIEGYHELAKWLVEKEVKFAINACKNHSNSSDIILSPSWLREAVHKIVDLSKGTVQSKLYYFSERWESGAAIQRMAIAVANFLKLNMDKNHQ